MTIITFDCRNSQKVANNVSVPDQGATFNDAAQKARWFLLPLEAKNQMVKTGWSKLKKASADKLNIRTAAGGSTVPETTKQQKKKKYGDDEVGNEAPLVEGHMVLGTLAGGKIPSMQTTHDETNVRKINKAEWLTRQFSSDVNDGKFIHILIYVHQSAKDNFNM